MKDFVFDHHFLARWRQHWPQAEVHEYPDCGHYILEDAAPGIIDKIRGFFP
jgi:haloalkane dehalogenase